VERRGRSERERRVKEKRREEKKERGREEGEKRGKREREKRERERKKMKRKRIERKVRRETHHSSHPCMIRHCFIGVDLIDCQVGHCAPKMHRHFLQGQIW